MNQSKFCRTGFLGVLMIFCSLSYAQDALTYLELNDKELTKCLKEHKDTLACYDGYFRMLDSNVTDVYIAVKEKLSVTDQAKLEKTQAEWQQNKYFYYGKNYTDFRTKFPKGNMANPTSPEEKKLLAEGYKNSALHARKRIVYLLSLIDK